MRGPSRPFVLSYPWFMLAGTLAVRRWRRGLVLATGAIILNRVDLVAIHYCHQVGPATPSRASWPFRLNASVSALLGQIAERVCFPLNRPRWFVCVSEGVADEIREHFPRLRGAHDHDSQRGRHRCLRAGFAPRGGRGAARGARHRRRARVAIFVGSEWQRKGLEPAIRALALAPAGSCSSSAAATASATRRSPQQLGVADAVRWIGVSRDVAPLYQLADAFVFPTSYEAFPLVALEAAASGLPILATPVNGVRELVVDGVNGFLIAPDPDDIAGRLRMLADDPALLRRLGRAARSAALEYSWEKMVERHHQLYSRLGVAPGARERRSASLSRRGAGCPR